MKLQLNAVVAATFFSIALPILSNAEPALSTAAALASSSAALLPTTRPETPIDFMADFSDLKLEPQENLNLDLTERDLAEIKGEMLRQIDASQRQNSLHFGP